MDKAKARGGSFLIRLLLHGLHLLLRLRLLFGFFLSS